MAEFNSEIKVSFIEDFSRDVQAARKQLEGLSTVSAGFNEAGLAMLRMGAGLTAGVTAPLADVGVAAYRAGEELNRGMANVQSLGLTQARVAELKRGVQDAAIATRTSTSDMSEGLYQVISAMGDSSNTLSLLEINSKAATAGLASITDAINLSSAVMKGYGEVSVTANQKVADLALQTVNLGQTTFPELAASIGRVTPLAAEMQVPVEELFATLATLTGVTGGAAEVTTQMRGAMQAFMAPSREMSGLLASLGFESGKALIEQLGFHGAILEVVDASKQSGKSLQSLMGSIEGQTMALALAGGQADVYPEKLAAMASAAGATETAFLAQTEGINANGSAMDLMRVKLEVMMQRLADGLAPAITAAMNVVGPFIDKIGALSAKFAELEPAQQKNIVKILDIAAVAGPALMALGELSRGIGGVLSATRTVALIFGGLVRGISGVVSITLRAIPSILSFAAANWAALAPVLAVIAGIGALIAVGVLVVKHWDKIKTFFVNLWEGVKNIFRAAIDWVVGILDNKLVQGALVVIAPFIGIPLAIIKNWDAIKNFFAGLWEGIKNVFSAGIDWIKGKLANIPLIGGLFDGKEDGLFGGRRNPGAAVVDTLAAGMTDALPAAEQAGLTVASRVDDYIPHSDAKKGPLSRLTESGGSLIETLRQGVLKKRLDLSGPLGLAVNGKESSGSGSTVVNIDNLTVQSDEAEDIFSFVRMLKAAGGAA